MFTDSINDFKGSQRSYFCCTVDRYIRDMHRIMGSHPATLGHSDWWHQEWDCWEQVFFWCKLVTSKWNVNYSLCWQAYSAVWPTIQWFVKFVIFFHHEPPCPLILWIFWSQLITEWTVYSSTVMWKTKILCVYVYVYILWWEVVVSENCISLNMV